MTDETSDHTIQKELTDNDNFAWYMPWIIRVTVDLLQVVVGTHSL